MDFAGGESGYHVDKLTPSRHMHKTRSAISQSMTEQKSTTAPPNYFAFLDALRSTAALLVVWDHFVGSFCARNGVDFAPLKATHKLLTTPLGIIQDFGFLGVSPVLRK